MGEENNIKNIGINISENGYVVYDKDTGKSYVFTSAKKMRDWLKDNLAPTGEVERFSAALDSKEEPRAGSFEQQYNSVFGVSVGKTNTSKIVAS